MIVLNAPPPAGMPSQVVVLDREAAKQHPLKSFYLRRILQSGEVATHQLASEATLPGAVAAAIAQGFHPTHWMDTADSIPSAIPDACIHR